jgi:pimeloyl-ACP methyl ester carboxylesterase
MHEVATQPYSEMPPAMSTGRQNDSTTIAGAKTNDPNILAPLAPFEGRVPGAPSWFKNALAQIPERQFVTVADARIETLAWGKAGQAGVLLLHGNGAHADWYSFVAPLLARNHRVVSLSWSGMGGSDWRQHYSYEMFVREVLEVLEAQDLFASAPPVVIGHSFGAQITVRLAALHGDRLAAAILVDPPVFRPERVRQRTQRHEPKPHRIYPDLPAALARFRLAPAQPCENLFIVDHIARLSLREVADEARKPGWSWRFDPYLWASLRFTDPRPFIRDAKCPLALIRGASSRLMERDDAKYMQSLMAATSPYIEIPEADHHVMLDQPLAFVAAVETLLTSWPPASRQFPRRPT